MTTHDRSIIFPTKKVDSPHTPLSIYLFKVNNRNT